MGPNFVLDKGFQATTAIIQFRAVTLVANDQVKQADAGAQFAIGIGQETVSAADAAQVTGARITDVRILGISRAINGTAGALARMTRCAVDSVGRVVAATTGQAVLGVTMSAATAQGDQVDFLLTPGVVQP
jgi:hypothetical protein